MVRFHHWVQLHDVVQQLNQIIMKTKTVTLQNVISTETSEWEVLKDGEVWTNGIKSEQECLEEIEYSKSNGANGKWSYREYLATISIGKTVEC